MPRKPNRHELIRRAVADYVYTEGCSCCQDVDGHRRAYQRLGQLLRIPRYKDGSGYNFASVRKEANDAQGA